MWTHSVKLPIKADIAYDEDGFEIATKEQWLEHIPASITDATRSDARTAYEIGYEADINVEMMACNYDGQRYLINEATGEKFYINRTFKPDKSMKITLTCSRTEGRERWRQ